MTDYLKTREVLKRLNIEIFELFDLCKNGKLPVYNEYGKKMVDPGLCKKGKKDSFDEVLRLVRFEEGTQQTGHVIGSGRRNIEKALTLTREEQEREARRRYNAQQTDSLIIPKDCVLFDFSFPARPLEHQTFRQVQNISKQKIEEILTFKFKKSDVKRLEIEYGIKDKPLSKSKQLEDLTAPFFPLQENSISTKLSPRENDDIDQPYVFKKEAPTWRIHYEGAKLNGLRCNGFELFYYLVVNAEKIFHTEELSQEIDKILINKGIDIGSLELGHDQIDDNHRKKGKKTVDVNAKIYGNSLEQLKKYRLYLQAELREAKSDNDPGRIEKYKQESTEFNKHCTAFIKLRGQSRNEIDQTFTNKNRLCKRMERALNELKKHDEKTYLHFKNSLSPINSFFQSYNPDRPINWYT